MLIRIWLKGAGNKPKLITTWEEAQHIPRQGDTLELGVHSKMVVEEVCWGYKDHISIYAKSTEMSPELAALYGQSLCPGF